MANFVMVVYRNDQATDGLEAFKVSWPNVNMLPTHLGYLAVRVFHQQSGTGNPNEVNFNSNDLIYMYGDGIGLVVGREDITPSSLKEFSFDAPVRSQENKSIDQKLRDTRVNGAKQRLLTADFNASDHDDLVAAAMAMDKFNDILVPWIGDPAT